VQRRAFSGPEVGFLVGVPLAWAVLLLFHPSGGGAKISYAELQDKVTPWLVVHIGMMFFIPLMAMVIYLLLRGVEGTAARVTRIALVPFVVFYSAWEVLLGIGTGVLANDVNGLPEAERATGATLVDEFTDSVLVRDLGVFASIGSIGLITAAIAAAVALRRQLGAPLLVTVLLGLSGFLISAHPPPYGPIGLALFIAAVLLFVRSQSAARTPTRRNSRDPYSSDAPSGVVPTRRPQKPAYCVACSWPAPRERPLLRGCSCQQPRRGSAQRLHSRSFPVRSGKEASAHQRSVQGRPCRRVSALANERLALGRVAV
jgi:hypothetical protein